MDVVKRLMDAFNRGAVDAFLDLATPDFEGFPAMILAVEGESYRGGEGMERYLEMVGDAWEELRVQITEPLTDQPRQ